MLDEQTTVLTNLGSGEEATLLRAKIQSRSLLSDMESFKVGFLSIKMMVFFAVFSLRQRIHWVF